MSSVKTRKVIVMNKKILLILAVLFMSFVFITSCGKTNSGVNNDISAQNSETKSQEPTEEGDGTVTITLNISNPEQKQEEYNIIFAAAGSFKTGEPIYSFKSYTVGADATLAVNISSLILYCETDESGNFKIGLTAARLEDVNVRNPLSEIKTLTFPDLQTCSGGNDITLDMTDKPLTSLYPEGTLLIRVIDPEKEGGYIDFLYKSATNMSLKYGRGVNGPDFLAAFEANEFKTKGIRDAVLVITDANNQEISERMELKFYENGYCKQGQYIEVMVNR